MKKTFTIYEEETISKVSPVSIQKVRLKGKSITLPTAGIACCSKNHLVDILEFEKKVIDENLPDFDQVSIIDLPLYAGNRLIREVKHSHEKQLYHRIISFTPLTEFWYIKNYEIQESVSASGSGVGSNLKTFYLKTRIKGIKGHLKQKDRVISILDQLKTPGKLKLIEEGFALQKEASWLLPVTPAIYDSFHSLAVSVEMNALCHDAVKINYRGDIDYGFYFNLYSRVLTKEEDVTRISNAICDLIIDQIKLHPADEIPSVIVLRICDEHEMEGKIEKVRSLKLLVENIVASIQKYDVMLYMPRAFKFGFASLFKGAQSYSLPVNLKTKIKDTKAKYSSKNQVEMTEWSVYDSLSKGTIKLGELLSQSSNYRRNKKHQPYTDLLFGGKLGLQKIIDSRNSSDFARYRNSSVIESLHNEMYQFISALKEGRYLEALRKLITDTNDPLKEEFLK